MLFRAQARANPCSSCRPRRACSHEARCLAHLSPGTRLLVTSVGSILISFTAPLLFIPELSAPSKTAELLAWTTARGAARTERQPGPSAVVATSRRAAWSPSSCPRCTAQGSGIRSELTESHQNSSISEGSKTNLVLQNLNISRNLSENRPKFAQFGWDRFFPEIDPKTLK